MKNIINKVLVLLLVLFASFSLMSCDTEEKDTTNKNVPFGTLSSETYAKVGNITISQKELYNEMRINGYDYLLDEFVRVLTNPSQYDLNDEKVDKAIDSGLGEKLGSELMKKGVRPLIWADYGFVQYANNKKLVKTPADFDGLKIRGYSKYSAETIKAMGASSVTMGSSEVYMGIQRGTIDGQTSGTTAMRDRKMYEVHKYLTVTNHASPEFIVAINEKSYSKLNADQKKALDAAAIEVRDMIRANAKAEDLKALADLKAKGMEVYEVPENELQAWRDATKPVWDLFIKENGKFGQELIDICVK